MSDQEHDANDAFLELPESGEDFTALHGYRRALEQELLTAEISPNDNPDEVRIKVRTAAIPHVPRAVQRIADLIDGAEKETTSLSAARAMISLATTGLTIDEKDPLKQFFADLTKTANE
jgi:hypothetical protein